MNLVDLSKEIEERYKRYLTTTFYFKDPVLRASFTEALNAGVLSKGPYLEATPIFTQGLTPKTLFPRLLDGQPDEGFLQAVHGNRPLYKHQEQAIEKVSKGCNVVVATGTGSGKTESFLYPILLHLYHEFLKGSLGPGVRALILYPMNALANDQRERLGQICKKLHDSNSRFQFTFGQYIGETPKDENDSRRHAQEHLYNRFPGELVLRSEMRENPPNILLTNYSMLEYLLLRPYDSPLFDHGKARWWKFIVLDEAHQYRGTKGMEMAFLIRRLKQRLNEGGRSEPFSSIATSASLTGNEEDAEVIANFASGIFGEKFQGEDIILGETLPISQEGHLKLTSEDYRSLENILQDDAKFEQLFGIAKKLNVEIHANEPPSVTVGRILKCDRRVFELRQMLLTKPIEVGIIADAIFDEITEVGERIEALSSLIAVLLKAKEPGSDRPLLSARYHVFLKSLEGAFVSYWPEKRVVLERGKDGHKTMAFEVAICRECGQHYFVGSKESIKSKELSEAIRDPSSIDFGAVFFRPIENDEQDELEEENSKPPPKNDIYFLCVHCGRLYKDQLQCGHDNSIRVVKESAPKDKFRADEIARCSACGYHAAGRDPVREVVYGSDGPNAVVATTLFQLLPENRKKILAFADSRQQAAFFAWYLESSYRNILNRSLMYHALKELSEFTSEGISLRSLAAALTRLLQEKRLISAVTDILELNRQVWCEVYHEFLTDEQRISLEGVGLATWQIKWPDWYAAPKSLMEPPWNLDVEEARNLLAILLDTMRTDHAVEIRTQKGVLMNWSDLGLKSYQMRVQIGPPRKQSDVRSWNGKRGKRARFLAKLLMRLNRSYSEKEANDTSVYTLRALWDEMRANEQNASLSQDRLMIPVNDACRLNPDWYRVCLLDHSKQIFQCDICGRIHALSVRDVCTRHQCPGVLVKASLEDLKFNHYRQLYQENLGGNLRVEEHTAQLDHDKAREFQHDFNKGKINVLSCSTTFELGVDLGDLDTIFLRNVPPEPFNYAQRVGRAGRRTGYPGFTVTFCRRSAHDLYHFAEPERMLIGKTRPPVLSLKNEKIIIRHVAAVAFSKFFQKHFERFESVEHLLGNLACPTALSQFRGFIMSNKAEIERALNDIIPDDMKSSIGLLDGRWISKIADEESEFAATETEVSSDFTNVTELETSSAKKGDYNTAKWARTRARTIAEEDVLSFLSRKAIIPKYGFPVDVVELDTQRSKQAQESFEVSLQRNLSLAIAEFAPTSKLIANKKEWTSYGLKKVAEKEWPRKLYKFCARHNAFVQWAQGESEPVNPCGCSLQPFQYIEPRFGFVTNLERAQEPKFRTERMFSTRPFFQGLVGPDRGEVIFGSNQLSLTIQKASPARMVILCEGRRGEGFYICRNCGAGFRKRAKQHKTSYGQGCQGMLEQVSLGHEFVTDVLQVQFNLVAESVTKPIWLAYSLAYALVEGAAEFLELPISDLNATVKYVEGAPIPSIVLYDNVPGGAGLVARLEEKTVLKECLAAAYKRVSGQCGCGENDSCYGCLRNYGNEFVHKHLQRGVAKGFLKEAMSPDNARAA